ncbi:MAG: radical SAM protein [Desulfovibrio sp.]|nr:radical SAM protein [Desulfovibrio sp.]
MAKHTLRLSMVMADQNGNIFDNPERLMLCRRGDQWGTPKPGEVIPLPPESELFLLPNRRACGLNPDTGEVDLFDELAIAAFLAPAHTISAHPAYFADNDAPLLPLFAYCAVGFANDQFYVCAHKVDTDQRQCFASISRKKIEQHARALRKEYPHNRLVNHILNNCVARYDCPAARNFALGRYEAPLPTSQSCNARCLGCISKQEKDSPVHVTPQCRLEFTPRPEEIVEVMTIHAHRERKRPIYSFGQGCEGDPLQNPDLLAESIRLFRAKNGPGTINCNTNGSRPSAIPILADAGLTSIRVSLNSAQEELYHKYYRPLGYSFQDVTNTIRTAREKELFVSLNLLYFPGITDTEEELTALVNLIRQNGVSMIQWRNLNIDPAWYMHTMTEKNGTNRQSFGMGLTTFMKRLKKECSWLIYGYFNPWLGEKAVITAPMPSA